MLLASGSLDIVPGQQLCSDRADGDCGALCGSKTPIRMVTWAFALGWPGRRRSSGGVAVFVDHPAEDPCATEALARRDMRKVTWSRCRSDHACQHTPMRIACESTQWGSGPVDVVPVRLDPELRAALAAQAAADHMNAGTVIRQALRAWLDGA